MNHDLLFNKIKAAADASTARVPRNRWGIVSSTRQTDTGYEVKVKIQPEDVLTGWLPVLSPYVGQNWGLVCPPTQGQQVFVAPDSGDHNHGVVIGMGYSTSAMPPQIPGQDGGDAVPVKPGQFAILHKNGSYLIFDDDDVRLVASRDLIATVTRNAIIKAQNVAIISAPTINIDADGKGGNTTVTITGDVLASGKVVAGNGGADQVNLQTHHGHTPTGGAPTPGT